MQFNKLTEVELTFDIEMTTEKLLEIIKRVEHAKKISMEGQVLRLKINHNTSLYFKEVGDKRAVTTPLVEQKEYQDVEMQ